MKRYIILGLLVMLAILVTTFPARIAYQWLAPPELQLTGVTGSIWHGQAREGLAAGAYVRDIEWRFKPAALLKGQLAFSTSSRPVSGTLTTDVAVTANGNLALTDLSGSLPLGLAHPAFEQNGVNGDLTMNFATLVISNGVPVDVEGAVMIENLFAPALSAAPLGSYRADFKSTGDGVTGTVQDTAGMLDVTGNITIDTDQSYRLLGEVRAIPGAPPSIDQQLQFALGSPDANGFRPFRFEGRL